jgi:lipopolysaccharide/colanic/teichoic acid biosynthesis glycosyltransferase
MRAFEIRGTEIPRWKRAVDLAGSALGLLVLGPLFLLVAIYIKLVSRGPVFFRQERVGLRGKRFVLWKFRTMRAGADDVLHREYLKQLIGSGDNGRGEMPMRKLKHDPRIIPLGRLLRSSCLDELPQLINVLKGEMSLVGPRPAIPYEVDAYLPWHKERLNAAPGMTGLWQVSGKNRLTFNEMVRLDIEYAEAMSPWLDAKILLKTIPVLIGQMVERLSAVE